MQGLHIEDKLEGFHIERRGKALVVYHLRASGPFSFRPVGPLMGDVVDGHFTLCGLDILFYPIQVRTPNGDIKEIGGLTLKVGTLQKAPLTSEFDSTQIQKSLSDFLEKGKARMSLARSWVEDKERAREEAALLFLREVDQGNTYGFCGKVILQKTNNISQILRHGAQGLKVQSFYKGAWHKKFTTEFVKGGKIYAMVSRTSRRNKVMVHYLPNFLDDVQRWLLDFRG